MYASITRLYASIENSSVMLTLMPSAMSLPHRLRPFDRSGNFDHHVAAIDRRPEPRGLGDRVARASFAAPGDTSIDT